MQLYCDKIEKSKLFSTQGRYPMLKFTRVKNGGLSYCIYSENDNVSVELVNANELLTLHGNVDPAKLNMHIDSPMDETAVKFIELNEERIEYGLPVGMYPVVVNELRANWSKSSLARN